MTVDQHCEKKEQKVETERRRKFLAADVVLHRPSGETWALVCDEEDGSVIPAGWPETWAKAEDLELKGQGSQAERLDMLEKASKRTDSIIGGRARAQLEAFQREIFRTSFEGSRIGEAIDLGARWTHGALGPGKYTASLGTVVDFFNPETSAVPGLYELVIALANQCRWGGHVAVGMRAATYSVAQHSVWVSRMCYELAPDFAKRELSTVERVGAALAGLTHDIEEGVGQDLIRPVKHHMGQQYRWLCEVWRTVIHKNLGIADIVAPWEKLVEVVDNMALAVEDQQVRSGTVAKLFTDGRSTFPLWVHDIGGCLTPDTARIAWIRQWNALRDQLVPEGSIEPVRLNDVDPL